MTLPGITFSAKRPVESGLSSRADVAMFVGCVARRAAAPGAAVSAWLDEAGFTKEGLFQTSAEDREALLGVPVPVFGWGEFEALFAWDRRPVSDGAEEYVPTALGLAVRSFFEEGGAKAYVVRTGDPPPLDAGESKKLGLLDFKAGSVPGRHPILPGSLGRGTPVHSGDPATWRGAGAVFAVPDAAMLLVPDLIDLCAGQLQPVEAEVEPTPGPEQFIPCARPATPPQPERRPARPEYQAPRLDRAGYARWGDALAFLLEMTGRPGAEHRRDVMLVSAFPLPRQDLFQGGEERSPLAILTDKAVGEGKRALWSREWIGNPRLQIAYPWAETGASFHLPEGLQSPEGLFAGVLARTALADGAFRSAAGRACSGARRLHPELSQSELRRSHGSQADWLGERLSLIGVRRGRTEWLSDSTLAADRRWRAGGVSRLMGIILRASRHLGQELIFEPSGPRLWDRLRGTIEAFLDGLRARGAFAGRSREEAFEVSCDQSSTTQADIDSGRLVCRLAFTAAYPIERIEVLLNLVEPPTDAVRRAA